MAYIGLLTAVAGDGLTGQITAAIVIFRTAQWLAVIPIGWILLVIMRGSHWREIGQAGSQATGAAEVAGARSAG
jgi:hypothetical protein